MAPERYSKPPQAPPLFTHTAKTVIDDARKLNDRYKSLLDKISAQIKPKDATFKNVMLPMVQEEDQQGLENRILGFYNAVSTDKDLRDASASAETMLDEANIEASMREDIYALVEAVYQRKESLDPESQRLLEKDRKNFIKMGLGIEAGPKRDRFKEIKLRLTNLSTEFGKNLNEENGGLWFTKEELAGVPDDVVDGLEKGTGDNEGKVKLTFKYPDVIPAGKFALSAETRKKVFIATENKVCLDVTYCTWKLIRVPVQRKRALI